MSNEAEPRLRRIPGVVARGHAVASGQALDSPYPEGTIALQTPVFRRLGLDISRFFAATVNIDIRPHRFRIRRAEILLRSVRWCDEHPPEDFSFSRCKLIFCSSEYDSMVYYPHPETKARHFQSDQTIEVLAPFVEGLEYGSAVAVEVDTREIEIL